MAPGVLRAFCVLAAICSFCCFLPPSRGSALRAAEGGMDTSSLAAAMLAVAADELRDAALHELLLD